MCDPSFKRLSVIICTFVLYFSSCPYTQLQSMCSPFIETIVGYNSNVRIAVVDPGTRIPFLFARCRYLSIFSILLLTN